MSVIVLFGLILLFLGLLLICGKLFFSAVKYIQRKYYPKWKFMLTGAFLFSSLVLRILKFSWRNSWCSGALPSLTGEFGIVALSVAHGYEIIGDAFFKSGIANTWFT